MSLWQREKIQEMLLEIDPDSDFLTRSFNSSGNVEKWVVPKKGLQPGNLNENSTGGVEF